MGKCQCGAGFTLPGLWVGHNQLHIPIAILHCKECGSITPTQIEGMVPYVAEKCESFPPSRGDYKKTEDGVFFTCPVCKGLSPLRLPTHAISEDTSTSNLLNTETKNGKEVRHKSLLFL